MSLYSAESINNLHHFPLLQSIARDATSHIDRLKPQEMDQLGAEVSMAFARCSIPESQVSASERTVNELMLGCIGTIDTQLAQRADRSGRTRDGALLQLYRKTVLTPTNMQAMFRMCDPKIRTGQVRCHALWHLQLIGSIPSSTSLKIPADNPNKQPPTSFIQKQIVTMATALAHGKQYCTNPKPLQNPDGSCACSSSVWIAFVTALAESLVSEPSPEAVLDILNNFDWPKILQDKSTNYVARQNMLGNGSDSSSLCCCFDTTIFVCLHRCAKRLLAANPDSTKGKDFLRNQLGSCQELLCTCLRRVLDGTFFANRDNAEPSNPDDFLANMMATLAAGRTSQQSRLEELNPIGSFLERFLHCLVPVPVDRETKALVRRARLAMFDKYMEGMLDQDDLLRSVANTRTNRRDESDMGKTMMLVQKTRSIMDAMDHWQEWHDFSEQERWERFRQEYLTEEEGGAAATSSSSSTNKNTAKARKDDRKMVQRLRQENKRHLTARGAKTSEMCANCFVLEKTLKKESNEALQKCSRCRQIKYCSRQCQREHWKKAHRHACQVVVVQEQDGTPSSSS